MDEHPGLRWHCRGSYVLVPQPNSPATSGCAGCAVPSTKLPDPLTLLETLTDECARYAGENGELDPHAVAWPLGR